MELTSENVASVLHDCLFDDDELPAGDDTKIEDLPAGTVMIEGILHKFGLKGSALESHREDVKSMLEQIKPEFFPATGGGYSFLGLPFTKDDTQWGEHINAEQLYVLARDLLNLEREAKVAEHVQRCWLRGVLIGHGKWL